MSYYVLQKYSSEVFLLKKHQQYYVLKAKDEACDEYLVLKQLNHPGIPRPVDFYSDGVSGISKQPSMIAEYIPGEPLINQILSPKCIYKIFYQLCNILMYVHQKEIYHRDIKPENIIYNRQTKQVSLIDWEYAEKVNKYTYLRGTPYYLAPEAIYNEHLGKSNDIWALGVCLYQIFTDTMPFEANNAQQLFYKVFNYKANWKHPLLPKEIIALLQRIFVHYKERISLEEIQQNLANLKD